MLTFYVCSGILAESCAVPWRRSAAAYQRILRNSTTVDASSYHYTVGPVTEQA